MRRTAPITSREALIKPLPALSRVREQSKNDPNRVAKCNLRVHIGALLKESGKGSRHDPVSMPKVIEFVRESETALGHQYESGPISSPAVCAVS